MPYLLNSRLTNRYPLYGPLPGHRNMPEGFFDHAAIRREAFFKALAKHLPPNGK
jgi:hypothetical protein